MHHMTQTEDEATAANYRRDLLQAPERVTFARITGLAARMLGQPAAALSVADETCQWLVARTGSVPPMTPLAGSPCQRVVTTGKPLVVADLASDPDYQDGLLATIGIRAYAAAPLLLSGGQAIGALCVLGELPRVTLPAELAVLQDLAALVMDAVASHRAGRIDLLSGLPNRQQLLEDLAGLAPGQPRHLALIDLAHPDELSHMLHAVGSVCLDEMASRDAHALHATLGTAARLYHMAPRQFALLAPHGTDPGELGLRLHADLSQAGLGRDALFSTTCTVGLASMVAGESQPADLPRHAQIALDEARAKRIPVAAYRVGQDDAFRRASILLTDFATALTEADSLRLVFQPRLELASGRCIGAEALLRWTHPTLGEISPGEFIPLVERTTLARRLVHWVLDRAIAQQQAWRDAGLRLQLSINISPSNLEDADFAAHVLGSLSVAALPPTALELEITETALMDEAGPALRQLQILSDAGVSIAIDDFGTGYSSLSYLQRLPANVIKIDQSFVRGLSAGGADEGRLRTLVTAMIGLSHDLGYRVVAEGIETQDAADVLRRLDCDEVQGYWFGRPMPPAVFATWFAQRPWLPTVQRTTRLRRQVAPVIPA